MLAGLLSGPLPKSAAERLALVDELVAVQTRRYRLGDEEAWLQATLGETWRGERTDFAGLAQVAGWLARVKASGVGSASDLRSVIAAVEAPARSSGVLSTLAQDAREKAGKPIARLKLDLAEAEFATDLQKVPLVELAAAFSEMRQESWSYADWAALARAKAETVAAGAGP